MKKAILFDLDGTLLPMDQEKFVNIYFGALAKKLAPYGYNPKKLVAAIWQGMQAMVENDGKRSNEEVFWQSFMSLFGEKVKDDQAIFDDFYKNDFKIVKEACLYHPIANQIIQLLKEKGYLLILATNPVFPQIATYQRCAFAGLVKEDFALITTYENSHSCKPNLAYYQEILKKFALEPQDCLMVGNDVDEDLVSKELGIDNYLITDCLINKQQKDISDYKQGSLADFFSYIKEEL